MKLVIEIPKEFRLHFELDRFNESLHRLRTDAHCVAGKYEKELCDMLIAAFKNGTPLPKGHGRLKDVDWIDDNCQYHRTEDDGSWCYKWVDIDNAPTIIEADKGEQEWVNT